MDIFVQSVALPRSLLGDGMGNGLRTARLTPMKKDDTVAGVRLGLVLPNSLLGLAGVHTGDIITSVNGYEMVSADQALTGYAEAQTGRTAVLELFRDGRRVILAIHWRQ
jgi:S1-C subfamily serine protease